ncbi:L-threonylcarbamoyladenylate synthase [Persephonella sp.]
MGSSVITSDIQKAVSYLKEGKLTVIPTDTLYGILTDALNKESVEKVYKIKKRSPDKPLLILIPDIKYLNFFGIKPSDREKKLLNHRGITVILKIPESKRRKFQYLHRGKNNLGFRIPDREDLIDLLIKVEKPLVAPSANIENYPPAKNIDEAVKYFGDNIDLYVDGGEINDAEPSTIVKFDGGLNILREGKTPREEVLKILGEAY